ncbi:MAG: pyruvate, phosphate dikinase [Planctomycetes bacterium]|nr:pyruvate, phosphate dikinase [Planctomycetota bacterium]
MTCADLNLDIDLACIEAVFQKIEPGDNIVWQVESIEDYLPLVKSYAKSVIARGERAVYFRFAKHKPLVEEGHNVEVYNLHPEKGFEYVITEIHDVIEKNGQGGHYIFDCLSELVVDWCSDRMLGNFFMLTCPYLLEHKAVAYFALLRNQHSFHATTPIRQTTQIIVDVYRHAHNFYIHPLKVAGRHSPTMYMFHLWDGKQFQPVMQSVTVTEILATTPWSRLDSASYRHGFWSSTFTEAEELFASLDRASEPDTYVTAFTNRLLRMAITREERIFKLAEKYLDLGDILEIRRRMIGTGLIGGKSVGMLLARAILTKTDPHWREILEPHDSFFIGADVFYTYLVQNGLWWKKQAQKNPETFLDGAEETQQRIMAGKFPEYIIKQFADMLDYFGQSPIIVRSSSLLEDNFGNAFAGRYESVFCVNQGSHQQRLEKFMEAVRTVYASTMSEKALRYRARRGLLEQDEQMALLIQRVSGAVYGRRYYPQAAGVGLSFNPYVWSQQIDPTAGVLRLVFGLGTRAVDRHDDDYTNLVSLNAPERRPVANYEEARQYTQRKVDLLDLESNQQVSLEFSEVAADSPGLPLQLFAQRDRNLERMVSENKSKKIFPWILTFKNLLAKTSFVEEMREMLKILHATYECPVDVEFTTNFLSDDNYKINLVQCRPLQVKSGDLISEPPAEIPKEQIVFKSQGSVIGQSRHVKVDRLIYVMPEEYNKLTTSERYSIARVIGDLTHLEKREQCGTIMLLGPGRWGTTTPALGVPLSFAEINTVSILCEIVAMGDGLVPDVSLGTHFFNDLVEMDMLYLALFPTQENDYINQEFLGGTPHRFVELLPEAEKWSQVIRVVDASQCNGGKLIHLYADTLKQYAICYHEDQDHPITGRD